MNTAGGSDDLSGDDEARVWELPARDPSLRDVLAQLDRIETKIDTLAAVAATWLREQDAHA